MGEAMTLVAPDHIKGRMTSATDKALKAERLAWVIAQSKAGHTYGTIAAALGISETVTCQMARKAGHRFPKRPPPAKVADRVKQFRMQVGVVGSEVERLPMDQQEKIIDAAIKARCSIAAMLVRYYVAKETTK